MPSPNNLPLSFNRDRAVRQLDARFEELLEKLRKNRPSEDPWMVRRAYEIATERHHDQSAAPATPISPIFRGRAHPCRHAPRRHALTAAILHDAIEDTEYPVSRIEERFGAESPISSKGNKNRPPQNDGSRSAPGGTVRKMLLAMVTDVRCRARQARRPASQHAYARISRLRKQHRISRETLDIYAPLPSAWAMSVVRGELEDLAFRYLEPEAFFALQKEISDKSPIHKKFLEEVQATNPVQTRRGRHSRRARMAS